MRIRQYILLSPVLKYIRISILLDKNTSGMTFAKG